MFLLFRFVLMFVFFFFFFNDTATTEIYTLSLHDALPICFDHVLTVSEEDQRTIQHEFGIDHVSTLPTGVDTDYFRPLDRKSTRLNSSHSQISYAVFCLKKKTNH